VVSIPEVKGKSKPTLIPYGDSLNGKTFQTNPMQQTQGQLRMIDNLIRCDSKASSARHGESHEFVTFS